ncbi:MAG: GtrA family protein [Clostridia bacterium]|nr:GtrA family protein [Clostridia bacterium]
MKKQNLIQIVKFTLFSISAGVIETVVYALLFNVLHLDYWLAYLPSLILSVLWNFTFNKRFTFKSAANVPIAMLKVFLFYLVFTPLSTYLGNLAETGGVDGNLVFIITLLCNFVLEFLYCKFVVYKNQENTLKK